MWVLLAKQDSEGWISKLKVRLTERCGDQGTRICACGCPIYIWLVLAMYIHELDKIKLYQCDIQRAYPNTRVKSMPGTHLDM